MKNTLKKLTALITVIAMLASMTTVAFAALDYSVEDAYEECAAMYPDFVAKVKAQGVTDRQIITFLETVQEYLLNLDVEITEDNFETYLIEAVNAAITLVKNIKVRDALINAFPEAVVDGADGVIHEDFVPLVETIKSIVFSKGILDDETDVTEENTEPTEATEPSTEAPTEAATEAPTNKPSGGGTDGGTASDDDAGEEAATEAPTENNTEKETVSFSDIDQALWAKDAINRLASVGVINGYGDGTFKPNNPITRAEFSKIIVLASGRYDEKETYTSDFKDVLPKDWHYSYVSAAYKFQFVGGRGAGIFDPNSNITRADLCLIVYRYIKSINPNFKAKADANGNIATFKDAANVPSWTTEAVSALYSNGIAPLRDAANNKFEPTAYATRAECAYIVHNAINAALGV